MAMRALSLWRPWPWCFFHAGKRIENRSWPPPKSILGQWVAMHAAKRFDGDALRRMNAGGFEDAINCPANMELNSVGDIWYPHPTGIVGAMHVVGYYDIETRVGRHYESGIFRAEEDPPWAFGPYCWLISGVFELEEPIPCKGRQCLWQVEPEIEREMRRQLGVA